MKALYFDCFAGISGDMTLGALIDLGASIAEVKAALKTLPVGGYTITSHKEERNHIAGTRVNVRVSKSYKHPGRGLSTILKLIRQSKISDRAKRDACGIFELIGKGESRVHNIPIDKVHFHEVGAVDSIVDIVGVAVAVDLLGIEAFHSAPVPLGRGFVEVSHGRLPVPVPATMEILEGATVYTTDCESELVTPTGAGILRYYCDDFSGKVSLKVCSVGYGLGERSGERFPGILRLITGDLEGDYLETTMEVIETNIDDMNPVFYDAVLEKLFKEGALDAYLTPLHMKKNRPGCLLTVLTEKPSVNRLVGVIFGETTTLGVRTYTVEKRYLRRKTIKVKTKYGTVRVKSAIVAGRPCRFTPEYDDCKLLSMKAKAPIQEIYSEAIRLAEAKR